MPRKRRCPWDRRRSVGRDLGTELALSLPMADLVTLDELDPRGLDVAIFSAGAEASGREAERLASAGVLVVDNSSAFRMRPDVPLVVPPGQPRRSRRPAGVQPRGQPQLLDHPAGARPAPGARTRGPGERRGGDLPGGVGRRSARTAGTGGGIEGHPGRPPCRGHPRRALRAAAVLQPRPRGRAAGRGRVHARGTQTRPRTPQDPRSAGPEGERHRGTGPGLRLPLRGRAPVAARAGPDRVRRGGPGRDARLAGLPPLGEPLVPHAP